MSLTARSSLRTNTGTAGYPQVPHPSLQLTPFLTATTTPSPRKTSSLKKSRAIPRTKVTAAVVPSPFLSTTSDTPQTSPPPYSELPPRPPPKKSRSTPQLSPHPHASSLVHYRKSLDTDSDGADEREGMLYTSARAGGFRSRFLGSGGGAAGGLRHVAKSITTAPGQVCAGETETEADEPPRHLPTARIVPESAPIVPPNTLEQVITPLLFETSRLLSIVPAVFGFLYNAYHFWHPPASTPALSRLDFFVSALWAVLTGVQCLYLTTGLLVRWKVYYPPLSTLIRLLALQAICWPATHFTLTLLDVTRRPVVCWAVIGSTTCVSRSIQLWVTSNLWWEVDARGRERGWRLKLGGRWGGRRWDWGEVLVKCGVPMGVCYFVMAWAEALRREWEGC